MQKCKIALHFEVNFGLIGTIGKIRNWWHYNIIFKKFIISVHNTLFKTLELVYDAGCVSNYFL